MKIKTITFFVTLLLTAVMLSSCSSYDDPGLNANQDKSPSPAKFLKRSQTDAIKIVNGLSKSSKPSSRSNDEDLVSHEKMVDVSNVQAICSKKSRSGSTDTLIHVINYTDNQGFVLVSANAETEPILAIIDNGFF